MAKLDFDMSDVLLDADNPVGKKQRRPLFKKKRSGEIVTREQVKAIKKGRKKLRKEMKARGIKSKEDFEVTASSLGLYFDKPRFLLWWWWLRKGLGLWTLLGALLALLAALFLYATVTQLRGHFTINMSDGMFREGFVLSETEDFANPTTHLFCEPAVDVPCISITHIPEDVDDHEGQHNESYFAYTYFVRNEGESTVGYDWEILLNSESQSLSSATWVMVFEDGEMLFYAKPDEEGLPQALPAFDDQSRGYLRAPLIDQNKLPDEQYKIMAKRGNLVFYRVIPKEFLSDSYVAEGRQTNVAPGDIHKYTVVIWLEGDDPQCNDDLIGGHVGMEMNMTLIAEESEGSEGNSSWRSHWDSLWKSLKFWQA